MTNPKVILDRSTGEMFELTDYYLRAKASDAAYKRLRLYKQRDKRHFTFTQMENIRGVIDKISTVHLGYLLSLQCYIEFGGKIKLSRQQMLKELGTSESTFQRFFSVVRSRGIIMEQNGGYYVNELYHYRGGTTSNDVIKLFTTQLRHLCHELQAAQLGFLYKLLPYVHYDTNMICHDPAANTDQVRFLNKTQIASLVGMDSKKTYKTLDKLKEVGVIAEIEREGNKRDRVYALNPYIFFRKSGTPNETLRGLFAKTPYNK